jgi:hypothetical protein
MQFGVFLCSFHTTKDDRLLFNSARGSPSVQLLTLPLPFISSEMTVLDLPNDSDRNSDENVQKRKFEIEVETVSHVTR